MDGCVWLARLFRTKQVLAGFGEGVQLFVPGSKADGRTEERDQKTAERRKPMASSVAGLRASFWVGRIKGATEMAFSPSLMFWL